MPVMGPFGGPKRVARLQWATRWAILVGRDVANNLRYAPLGPVTGRQSDFHNQVDVISRHGTNVPERRTWKIALALMQSRAFDCGGLLIAPNADGSKAGAFPCPARL